MAETKTTKKSTTTSKKTTTKKDTTAKTTTRKPRTKKETPPTAPAEQTFTKAETEEMIRAAVEAALAKQAAEMQPTRIYTTSTDELVTVMFLAEVSPNDVLTIPGYGSMRPGSSLDIPKKEFGGQFMSNLVRKLIDKRYLIVANGLTEDEQIRYNCHYGEGEVLDVRTFDRMLDLKTDELLKIFDKLCIEHKRFVCRRIITAHERKDKRISLEKVKAINDASKEYDPEGMLKPVMEAYAKELM